MSVDCKHHLTPGQEYFVLLPENNFASIHLHCIFLRKQTPGFNYSGIPNFLTSKAKKNGLKSRIVCEIRGKIKIQVIGSLKKSGLEKLGFQTRPRPALHDAAVYVLIYNENWLLKMNNVSETTT